MAATTYTPNAIAREASKVMGRTVTAKQVRGIARDTLASYSKTTHPAYQSHEYTAAERTALMRVFAARAGKGRTRTAGKATTVARKAARTRKVAAQSPEVTPDA